MFAPLYASGRATPVLLRTTWTLDDVLDVLESMVVNAENKRRAMDAGRKKGGR